MIEKRITIGHKLLIVEDDFDAAQVLKLALSAKGYTVFIAKDGQEGLQFAQDFLPDLVILDIMMPGMNGFDVCARLRELMDVPVLMLTAMVSEGDILHGFHVGADDYVRKPYSITELDARIRSLLRRQDQFPADKQLVHYFDGELAIDMLDQSAVYQGKNLNLTPTEFRVLRYLFCRDGKLATRDELLQEIWGDVNDDANRVLSMYISRIRQKLHTAGSHHEYIQTHRGKGYSFAALPAVKSK